MSRHDEMKRLLALPWEEEYRFKRIPEKEGGGFCAFIPILGATRCRGDGETVPEAIADLRNVLEDMLEQYLEKGMEIPTPDRQYSGTIVSRKGMEI